MHGRVRHDRFHNRVLFFLHGYERNVLRGLRGAHQLPGVLLREESFRHHRVKPDSEHDHSTRNDEHEMFMAEHPLQAAGIEIAHRIEAGMLWLNSHNVRDLRTPFGGVKASGLGREGGFESLDFFTEAKNVCVKL